MPPNKMSNAYVGLSIMLILNDSVWSPLDFLWKSRIINDIKQA